MGFAQAHYSAGGRWVSRVNIEISAGNAPQKEREIMKVVTLLNEKGGVGKTTNSINIAAGLAIKGHRVLLIDADAQANATQSFGVKEAPGLYDLLLRDAEWGDYLAAPSESVWSPEKPKGSLWLLPGNVETRLIPMGTSDVTLLYERLQEVADAVDVVVIDTPPTPSMLQALLFVATDYAIYPTKCEQLALEGVAKTQKHLAGLEAHRQHLGEEATALLGVQPTLYDIRTNAHEYGLSCITSAFKRRAWPALPMRTVYRDASFSGKILFAYAPEDNPAVIENWALVDRVRRGVA